MSDNLSVDTCLNPEITNIVEIKLIKAQFCWGDLAWKDNKGIPKCIPFREAKIGKFSPSGQDIQKHNFKTTKGCRNESA